MKKIYSNIIIVVAFIAIVYLFLFVPNWFHEQGHIREAKKQDLDFYYRFNGLSLGTLLRVSPIGESVPSSAKDCEKFNSLFQADKEKITHAGVLPEIMAFTVLYGVFVILLSRQNIPKWFWIVIVLMYLMYVLATVWNNVLSPNPLNDWHFSRFPDCSIYE